MSDDIELELTDASEGGEGPGTPLVFVGRETLAAIDRHAREDLDTELGGVLLGSAACSAEGVIVVVEAAIPALHTDAGRGNVTFTHETWEQINRIKDRDHPDKRIVGWYHTHPGFGLFLSDYDVFIHRHFFNLPWQVALVVDPRKGDSGFFLWEGDEIAGPRGFEVVGPAAPMPPAPAPAPLPPAQPVAAPAERPTWRLLMAAGLVALLVLQVFSLTREPVVVRPDETTAAEIARLRGMVERLEPHQPPPVTPPPETTPPETTVTVRPGDSLWRIAHEHYGDGALWGAIAIANDIVEPYYLEPGMVLTIPMPPAREADESGEPGTQ